MDGLSLCRRKHVVVGFATPLRANCQPLGDLAFAVVPEHLDRAGINAHHSRPSALGRALDALAADDSGRARNPDLGAVQVNVFPSEVKQFAPARTRVRRKVVVDVSRNLSRAPTAALRWATPTLDRTRPTRSQVSPAAAMRGCQYGVSSHGWLIQIAAWAPHVRGIGGVCGV